MISVPSPQAITSALALASLLRAVKAAVAAGTLVQVVPDPSPFALRGPISTVADAGPWPDYLEARFLDPSTGRRLKLTVESYHGVGGRWEVD